MTSLILPCGRCGQRNRVPAARLAESPRCGKCHEPMAPRAPVDVDEATLEGLIRESPLPVLADFWAPWCGPCRMVAPALSQIAAAQQGQVLVVKVNVDENQGAAARHDARSIPLLVLFQGGRELRRLVGAHPRAAIEQLVASARGAERAAYH